MQPEEWSEVQVVDENPLIEKGEVFAKHSSQAIEGSFPSVT